MIKAVIYPSSEPNTLDSLTLYIDDNGVLYEPYEGLLSAAEPPWTIPGKEGALLPGHVVDLHAPWRCSKCGTDRLQVFSSNDYQTSARCPDCGTQAVIQDG